MLFISRQIGNKVGVVDTDDWKEEVLTLEQLHCIRSGGITIQGASVQSEILSFMFLYDCIVTEVGGGSTLDMLNEYLNDNVDFSAIAYEIGSSESDLVRDVKSSYKNLRKKWIDLDVCNLGIERDLYYMIHSCLLSRQSGDLNMVNRYVDIIHTECHLDKNIIVKGLML